MCEVFEKYKVLLGYEASLCFPLIPDSLPLLYSFCEETRRPPAARASRAEPSPSPLCSRLGPKTRSDVQGCGFWLPNQVTLGKSL